MKLCQLHFLVNVRLIRLLSMITVPAVAITNFILNMLFLQDFENWGWTDTCENSDHYRT